jgi:hypothetical protein
LNSKSQNALINPAAPLVAKAGPVIRPAPLAAIDIAPCGTLRGAAVLRKFDFACVDRLRSITRAVAEGVDFYCVKQSFFIVPATQPPSDDLQAELFVQRLSKSSVYFVGSLTESRTGLLRAAVARTFVRVCLDGPVKRGLPFLDEERDDLAPDAVPSSLAGYLQRHALGYELLASPTPTTVVLQEAPIFAQTVRPRHLNLANHLDHGCLLSLAADAAALARSATSTTTTAAAAHPEPVAGIIEYLDGGGACGVRLECFADAAGAVSVVRRTTGPGSFVDVCRASWVWT